MAELRRQGIFARNIPSQRSLTVQGTDFSQAGLIGHFERKYDQAYEVSGIEDFRLIFGENVNPRFFGWDNVDHFFQEAPNGTLYVKSHRPSDSSGANVIIDNLAFNSAMRINSAYRGQISYGTFGNRTSILITGASRFNSSVVSANTTRDVLTCESVIGVRVGDIIRIGVTATTFEYEKVRAVSIGDNTVTLMAPTSEADLSNIVGIDVLGFRIQTFQKDINGVNFEVETELGSIICTMESEVQEFYVQNVHRNNSYISVIDLAPISPNQLGFPALIGDTVSDELAGGLDGVPTTSADTYDADNSAFDGLPIRMIGNCETTSEDVQRRLQTYTMGRATTDFPASIISLPRNLSKAELITAGQRYQTSRNILSVLIGTWQRVTNSFGSGERVVNAIGRAMGVWIRSLNEVGIHIVPATNFASFNGSIRGVADDHNNFSDEDRTDILCAGVNIIQNKQGVGFLFRNFNTVSTTNEYRFANGLIMGNFLAESSKTALQVTENEPTSFSRLRATRDAIVVFGNRLWREGNTGNVQTGEFFGQREITDGFGNVERTTTFQESFQVIANDTNNTQEELQAGNRNIRFIYSYPSPAGSIQIEKAIRV